MPWPWKRRARERAEDREAPPPETDTYDRAARNLIDQGMDPEKVERATHLIKTYVRAGLLPEGIVRPDDD